MDVRAAEARRLHLEVQRSAGHERDLRDQRDRLVRQLREEDPVGWTHARLAKAVNCSPELIAYIIRNPKGRT